MPAATTEAATEPIWTEAWLADFLQSSGFAGVLAVAAAFVAYLAARHTANRNTAAARELQARERWWTMFNWMQDEMATLDLPRATMVARALEAEAKTRFEREVLAATILRFLLTRRGRP
ncbi:hypothetical protein J1G44_14275 [Cellulomonas sp. zg-ZUI199]|uniref:Uncharacterized protein n=1 Tax=Cellulomonas wangleii TaxID=2816956 RepID=A0ABX8D077_9CELL|nr:hypothetical protein [Cellulomonas wangleii]MBO0925642.1 hypothetical protein [Cellulomonas wangleii]QVI60907.1 hypothetical protein KG103_10150 [Cellulomonas wangleii]